MTVAVEFTGVSRLFGQTAAVDNVSLTVEEGEFFSMLGPSGSGKTTSLRLIAGFEQPTSGSIRIFGQEAAGVPPFERDVNTVFQDYALFPHMNIRDNVAYGLMVKGIGKTERLKKAEEALAMVALPDYGDRKPGQLSGGQRQRVALARALVNQPRVLLLDEPLGALDLKLREQMQVELKTLHRKLGITFIYVTHDQGEALSMSDRVAVFNKGKIEQVDAPKVLYTRPKTMFVADFVGTANVVKGALAQTLTSSSTPFSIRPEHIRMVADTTLADHIHAKGEVIDVQYHGATSRIEVSVGGQLFAVMMANLQFGADDEAHLPVIGSSVQLAWPVSAMVPLAEG
ncbi:ABC transporter ATP-binding protein [Leeia sp. TBRC 13508]|uniref:ABC transporter ATP-binding protein n=1 Tax=Leeia speluncae TaxID=2884804 RepID=A0ABS8D3Y4_9NEIS|nr:ABC transporter ATP-binding protein [Leeia speluncae]MCB6182847.1 ABC transporter ATP-binding protein [Leeia speluncae]